MVIKLLEVQVNPEQVRTYKPKDILEKFRRSDVLSPYGQQVLSLINELDIGYNLYWAPGSSTFRYIIELHTDNETALEIQMKL